MNLRDRMIMEDFRGARPAYLKLEDAVGQKLNELVKQAGLQVLGIEHRVKAVNSLAGKLVRNGDRYQKLDDLTDLLGARIICFFPMM